MTNIYNVKLKKRKLITKDIYQVYFTRPNKFDFLAGQYCRIILPHENKDEKGSSRFFTISSTPKDEYLMITTRLRNSSFKKALLNLNYGNKISLFGPLGNLYPDYHSKNPFVFISYGLGITPYYSIINHINQYKIKLNLTLVALFENEIEIIYRNELRKISLINKQIDVHFINLNVDKLNNISAITNIKFVKDILSKNVSGNQYAKYYITGPQYVVYELILLLKNYQIKERSIFTEAFSGY